MITENPKDENELDQVPNADANGEPIYKIDVDETADDSTKPGEISNTADDSQFKDTPQDLKDTTSQE